MPHGGTIINFPGQESGEQIFIFTRRHVAAFLPILATILVMAILGGAITFILAGLIDYNIALLLGSTFLLFLLLFTLAEFFDFYFDLYIVTDRRVVDIDQNRFFNRSVAELLFEDVQDVESSSKGILATIFHYGNVEIQSAGTKPNFTFSQVANPNEVAAIILDISDQQTRGVAQELRHPEGPIAAIIDGRTLPHTPDHKNELPVV
jgi:hypothetical protein